jgi:hypothetical protein
MSLGPRCGFSCCPDVFPEPDGRGHLHLLLRSPSPGGARFDGGRGLRPHSVHFLRCQKGSRLWVSLFLPDQGLDSKTKFSFKLKGISVRSMAPHEYSNGLPFVRHGTYFQKIFLHAELQVLSSLMGTSSSVRVALTLVKKAE